MAMRQSSKAVLMVLGVGLSVACGRTGAMESIPDKEPWKLRVVASGLDDPFEITWGPDGYLWVTERTGRRVTRVAPWSGAKDLLLALDGEVMVTKGMQDGLLGMALNRELLQGTGNDYVYLAYTYDADPSPDAEDRRAKIVRYTYDAATTKLVQPADLILGLPASPENNAGRLLYGPDQKLYYTIGDQGNNQNGNACKPIRAQFLPSAAEVAAKDWTSYQGKVLRLNLDGSIPDDNPELDGVKSHIYSYGHRNAQGLAFGPDGTLFEAEHGPRTDDELNVIERAKNYGWPHVSGYQDDEVYVYANWSAASEPPCSELEYSDVAIPESVPIQRESEWSNSAFQPPVKTFYTVPDGQDFDDPACAEGGLYYLCWPTVAPSSVEVYGKYPDQVPWLAGSVLMASLKLGRVFAVKLGLDGKPLADEARLLVQSTDRYRDIAINPDGRTIYVATDSSGNMLRSSGRPTHELAHPGAILAFRAVD